MGGFNGGMSLGDRNVMRIMKMRDVKMRPIFLLIVFILPTMAHAQWTEQDSLRLQEFLSGKEEIRLNPEFQKAIESGTFLRPDQPGTHMLSSPSELPITKDFSEYVQLDTLRRLTNYDSITQSYSCCWILSHLPVHWPYRSKRTRLGSLRIRIGKS